MNHQDLISKDHLWIWHPYSQHGLAREPIAVRSAKGAYLELSDGRRVIDAISSWWVNVHGHGHPALQKAIAAQVESLDHVIFSGFTHEPAVQLAERLVALVKKAGAPLSRVFYSDNGSTAVEVALKMAFQYHANLGESERTRFIALRGSYHGDTLGAMAVAEPESFHRLFRPLLPRVDFIEPGDLSSLEKLLSAGESKHYAAFIFEPLIQGASGMRTYPAEFLTQSVELCRKAGVLTIADEVFTGFYRTGTCFAFEQAGISPDLVCLSKGLTGGILPMAVTLASEEIFAAFLGKEIRRAFLHGHSYTGNPIGCAAALASLELFADPDYQERIRVIAQKTAEHVQRLSGHPRVHHARSLGTIGAIELQQSHTYFSRSPDEIIHRSIEKGVLLRPLGSVLYGLPPYCVTDAELEKIYTTLETFLDDTVQ